jgi:L-lactate dehydrogenase (cytochrome)/(S)-mandelate dehydrogenase
MGVEAAINYDDLRRLAKRRLPQIAFDFLEGGVDDEQGLEQNVTAFSRRRLVPRYLIDTSVCDQSTVLFGRTYALDVVTCVATLAAFAAAVRLA